MLTSLVFWTTLVCIGYLLLVIGIYAAFVIFAAVEGARRRRERQAEDFETLETSRLTAPVSILVPAHNEAEVIEDVVKALLRLRYPEFEVVLVNDGSTDRTLERLRAAYGLRRRERFYRRVVDTAPVRAIYTSEREPRLIVVDKIQGGKADALNAALNVARYRYVCCVDGDTVYKEDALLSAMRLVRRDPERVIGLTGQIAVADRPERGAEPLDRSLLSNFQHIEYQRAFLNNRLAWSRLGFMLCTSGAFALYRRDVVETLGGFSSAHTCEDIEFTFRVHEHHLRNRVPYQIVSIPEIVAVTEAPVRLRNLISQRARWQRVTLETMWTYRHMFLNPRYGTVGLVGMPLYFLSEVAAPLVELVSLLTLAVGLVLGLVGWPVYVAFLATISFANGILFAAAILLDDATSRAYRLHQVVRLLVLGVTELVAYRPLLVWARLRGIWGFARGNRGWDRFERNIRSAAGA